MSGGKKTIDEGEVLRLAELARLDLGSEERAAIARDLSAILAYVDQLAELDLEGVPPTTHAALAQASLREDAPIDCFTNEVALREAPKTSEGGFAVPSFVDEDG